MRRRSNVALAYGTIALGLFMFFVGLAVLFLVNGCQLQAGPFLPSPPHACRADPDCADNQVCKYPSASYPVPICMPGANSVYAWSPTAQPGEP